MPFVSSGMPFCPVRRFIQCPAARPVRNSVSSVPKFLAAVSAQRRSSGIYRIRHGREDRFFWYRIDGRMTAPANGSAAATAKASREVRERVMGTS